MELLTALTIMVMVVGALGGITRAVQLGFEHSQGYGDATQHARVVLERIARMAEEAHANASFPGFVAMVDRVSSWRFPDTLVIWHPDGEPASPDGMPRLDELVIYCPHPSQPNVLVEVTTSRTAELSTNRAVRASQIEGIKSSQTSRFTTLTTLLRTGTADELRGAVRFETLLRPSDAQWNDGTISWDKLPWVQGIYGSQTGLRQAWVGIELQLMTGEPPADGGVDRREAIPFLGSAALYYTMRKEERP